MVFSSLPCVIADYTVGHASFPPDLPGDIVSNGKVDVFDVCIICGAYGSVFGGDNWLSIADTNDDGKVDMFDIVSVTSSYGVHYDTSSTPIAYSTSFEFVVPNDGNASVWYHFLVRVYVPDTLSGKTFYLSAGESVDDAIRNVKVYSRVVYPYQAGGLFNIELGQLLVGYHLLELEYLESIGGGVLNFTVKTAQGEYAWLDRYRVYVPNYSSNRVDYTVITDLFPRRHFLLEWDRK
jgi:hypothetical protein